MSNRLLNEYAKYTRPLSNPYNIFYNGKTKEDQSANVLTNISNHINTIGDMPYNLHYKTLANTDLAIDMFHVGMLYDREIYTNRVKNATNNFDTNIIQQGSVYDVSNNIEDLIFFPFTTDMSITGSNLTITAEGGYVIEFPSGNNLHGIENNRYEGDVFYKSKFSNGIDISLIYNDEFNHWDVSYNNGEIQHVDWICASGGKVTPDELLNKTNTYKWNIDQKSVIENLTIEISNNQGIDWKVLDISKGVVYIQQTSAYDLSYTFGFSDVYDISSMQTTNNQNRPIYNVNVYWVDMINQYTHEKDYNVATDKYIYSGTNKNITQVPFAEINFLDINGNSKMIRVENTPLNNGLRPVLHDISGYGLTTRYDTKLYPSLKTEQREALENNKYIYDELYYGHDWSRVQKYDISSSLQEVADFGDIYDLTDERLTHYNVDISRSDFNYRFPYLFYKCDSNADPLELNIKVFFDNLTDTSFNDVSFCDASSVLSTLNVGYAQENRNVGKYDFDGIDLMKCSIEMQENKYNSLTNTPFVEMSKIGQNELPSSYLFKGYYYGYYDTSTTDISVYPNINRDERYLVFKFKEPSSYPDGAQDNSTNYLLFDPITNEYRENVPIGGDPYKMIFGLQKNYDVSGYMIINPDIAERLYIPIELKPKSHMNIFSSMSNNTNVFILDIDVNENKFLSIQSTTIAPQLTGKKIIERNQSYEIAVKQGITMPTEIYYGIENKPVKYINGYDISNSLLEIYEYPAGEFKLCNRPYPWSSTHENYVLNKEYYFYYPLTGKVENNITSQWYVGEEKHIIETSFNTLSDYELMYGYIVTRNQVQQTAYNSSHAKITDLSMALITPNQGTKSYTYIPSYYFSESTKKVLNPIRNRVDFLSTDVSYGLIDKDKSYRISELIHSTRPGQKGIAKTPKRFVLATISPNEFSTSDGKTRYILPITSTKYHHGITSMLPNSNRQIYTEKAILAENYALDITVSAKHPIQTNNITIQTTDKTTINFNLPFRINDLTQGINETDLSFIIMGNSTLGDIVNPGNRRSCTFIPKTQYLGGNTAFSDTVLTDTSIRYKIEYNGNEYTEWNNTITINIVNEYDTPQIFNKTFNIYRNESIVVDLVQNDIFLIDDTFSNLEVFDIIGPFNGKKTENFNNSNFTITYEPDYNWLGVDYIFFKVKTLGGGAINSREGHVTFIVTPQPDDIPPPVIEYEPTKYEICNCRPVAYVNSTIETGGNNPKITLAEYYTMRSINMRHYGKTRQIKETPKKAFINQNMRSSNNLRNF